MTKGSFFFHPQSCPGAFTDILWRHCAFKLINAQASKDMLTFITLTGFHMYCQDTPWCPPKFVFVYFVNKTICCNKMKFHMGKKLATLYCTLNSPCQHWVPVVWFHLVPTVIRVFPGFKMPCRLYPTNFVPPSARSIDIAQHSVKLQLRWLRDWCPSTAALYFKWSCRLYHYGGTVSAAVHRKDLMQVP